MSEEQSADKTNDNRSVTRRVSEGEHSTGLAIWDSSRLEALALAHASGYLSPAGHQTDAQTVMSLGLPLKQLGRHPNLFASIHDPH